MEFHISAVVGEVAEAEGGASEVFEAAFKASVGPLPVVIDDPAGQHRTARLDPLPAHRQPELTQAGERRQVRAGEGSVGHVWGCPLRGRSSGWAV